jgi:hypothetical protein
MKTLQAENHILIIESDLKDELYGIRFDGCIHIEHWSNGSKHDNIIDNDDRDYLHICDLHGFIETLQQIESEAKKHFGDKWPKECK